MKNCQTFVAYLLLVFPIYHLKVALYGQLKSLQVFQIHTFGGLLQYGCFQAVPVAIGLLKNRQRLTSRIEDPLVQRKD